MLDVFVIMSCSTILPGLDVVHHMEGGVKQPVGAVDEGRVEVQCGGRSNWGGRSVVLPDPRLAVPADSLKNTTSPS